MPEHPPKLLIIEDDDTFRELLELRLSKKGYVILAAPDGASGLRLAYEHHPDLVLLDVMMPNMDGFEACRRLREMSDVPILMVTAKTGEQDVLLGFRSGADDYLRKPFLWAELEERIQALLKRSRNHAKDMVIYDDGRLMVDLNQQQVYLDTKPVHLTPMEFRLLKYLVQHQGVVLPHKEILSEVWGPAYEDAVSCLSVYIRYLREKLEEDPSKAKYIRSKWGVGYWFAPRQCDEEQANKLRGY